MRELVDRAALSEKVRRGKKALRAPRTKRGRMIRLFIGYGLAAAALVAVFVVGSKGQQLGDNNFTYLSSADAGTSVSFINVMEASLVAQSADAANLASSGDARDMANSLATIFAAGGGQDQPITIITASRGVEVYRVREGDTVASIAKARGITEQTLRWANDMRKSVQVSAGQDLLLPASNGVIYTWSAGDTVEKVAAKYKGDVQQIIAYNELDNREVAVGERIFIPDGILPNNERPDYVPPLQAVISGGRGNLYAWGQCTYYAYSRRRQLNLPVENNWGHARTWASRARAMGYAVGTTPAVHAIMHDTGGAFGHVAIVESINSDGTITISEMNYAGRRNVITRRNIAMEVADGSCYRANGRNPVYSYIY
jgi:surface antigen